MSRQEPHYFATSCTLSRSAAGETLLLFLIPLVLLQNMVLSQADMKTRVGDDFAGPLKFQIEASFQHESS